MSMPVLATKLFAPARRSKVVLRPHLFERLNEGMCHNREYRHKFILISAPAGFGKTTLISEWIAQCDIPTAWLSLDESDNDVTRFLLYVVAALQTVNAQIGKGAAGMLLSPQPPPVDLMLTTLLNEVAAVDENFLLVLDDYHVIDSKAVDQVMALLIDRLPPQMGVVVITREDPQLPLARYRARGQLIELRAADLRFTNGEASEFLNQVMGLQLSVENINALEARTEGWVAGLQLVALALQGTISKSGHQDVTRFIESFTGSHHFVMDYLVEEVLHQQPENVQTFLLCTSILDRLCGPLCDAVLATTFATEQEGYSQKTLEYLERANLFLIPLDNERRWYRYHHLFADLLRQRLQQNMITFKAGGGERVAEFHLRASQWYEDNGYNLEAFQHAAAAGDVERAERLIEEKNIPMHFGGPVNTILNWLESLPKSVLDARPSLWWRHASLLLIAGRTDGVEEKLQAAEAALAMQGYRAGEGLTDTTVRNLIGKIATARSTLALTRYDTEAMLAQSQRALDYLDPKNMFTRATAYWTQGYARLLLGDRAAARRALLESIALSRKSGVVFTLILSTIGLGNVQELDLELHQAAETYRQILQMAGDQPQQIIHEAHLGLARILYQWNDLDAAEQHGQQSLVLANQYDVRVIDRFILCEVFLARLKLAQGDIAGATAMLERTHQSARQRNFFHRLPEVAAAQVIVLLKQGKAAAAAQIAGKYDLPLSQARVDLAQGRTRSALKTIETFVQMAAARSWQEERLRGLILQAVAFQAAGDTDRALSALDQALALAEPGGLIRTFLDEGPVMAQLLSEVAARGTLQGYVSRLLAAFEFEKNKQPSQPLLEPLSQRELEILRLVAQGLSNHEISERLFLAVDTVKGHNRRIFEKLHVKRRTEAVARARELGLL